MCSEDMIYIVGQKNKELWTKMSEDERRIIVNLCTRFLLKRYEDAGRIFNFLLFKFNSHPEIIIASYKKPREEWLPLYEEAKEYGIRIGD